MRHAEVIGAREPVARRVSFRAPHVEARSADAGPAIPVSSTPHPDPPPQGGRRDCRASARPRKLPSFFSWRHFLDRSAWCSYSVLPLDERRSQRARRKAAASASQLAKPREVFKGRDCETLAGMKGWRPSAWLKLETGSGSLSSGRILAGHRIDRCLFPRVLGPRPRAHNPGMSRGSRVPLFAVRLRGRRVGPMASRESAIEMAPALHLLHETGGRGNEDKRNNPCQRARL